MSRTKLKDRVLPKYTRAEDLINMISHIVGGVFAISALVLCVVFAALNANVWGVVGGAIYGTTMIILYTMSSIYHGMPEGLTRKVFQVIDHCAVYLLIAGTYTPFTLVAIRSVSPGWGWSLFGVVWAATIVGIVLSAVDLRKFRVFSMICYIASGWCIVLALPVLLEAMPIPALVLLISGGIAYTLGAVLYGVGKKVRYMHSIFHLLVLAGSVLHFIAILGYVM